MPLPMTLQGFYDWSQAQPSAMAPHLTRLRQLAAGLPLAVEFGVKRGASSAALLLGADHVISYDLVETPHARHLERIAGPRWEYRLEDSRTADVPQADLILLDSLHTYAQVDAELTAHGDKARRYLVFHDVTTFGEIGAVGETGAQSWTYRPGGGSVPPEHWGIRPAIDAFMAASSHWRIKERYVDSHGLLVLERRA